MMIEWQLVLSRKMISVMRTAGNSSQTTPLSINISSATEKLYNHDLKTVKTVEHMKPLYIIYIYKVSLYFRQ